MTINEIIDPDVRFASMVNGYKIYHPSRENSVSGMTIYVAYQMLKENVDYDLCELLQNQLIKNLNKLKKDKKNTFKYGTLVVCLFFYFMNEVLGIKGVHWTNDKPVAMHIRNYLHNIGDSKAHRTTIWGYFKNF